MQKRIGGDYRQLPCATVDLQSSHRLARTHGATQQGLAIVGRRQRAGQQHARGTKRAALSLRNRLASTAIVNSLT